MSSQVVLITGATSGLGLAIAARLLSNGAEVHGISKSKRRWSDVQKKTGFSNRFHLHAADASQETTVRRLLQDIYAKSRRIDTVINCAGYVHSLTRVEDLTLSEFKKNIEANLVATFLICKHALPYLKKQGSGTIINISSMAGKRAVPQLGAYSASKFGVMALAQCMAKENPNPSYKFITVCPGGMSTPMRRDLYGKDDADKQQSPDFVAKIIEDVLTDAIVVESGGDIIIRHGEISAINAAPPP